MLIEDLGFVDLATSSGLMRTYGLRPAMKGQHPGVIVYSEIFQVTGWVRRWAAWLAGHGFVVLMPEIFHELEGPGTVLAYDGEPARRGNAHKKAKPRTQHDADAVALLSYLESLPFCNGRVGVVGSCVGGHLAVRAAMRAEVSAAVCYYATDLHQRSLGSDAPDDTLDRLGEVKGELLMIWGNQDPHIPSEGRARIYGALQASKVDFSWHEFRAAHAFLRDEGHRYNPFLAGICQALTLEVLGRCLKEK